MYSHLARPNTSSKEKKEPCRPFSGSWVAAEPGSSEGAAEVVAGVGQIFKVELKLAATSPVPAIDGPLVNLVFHFRHDYYA